MFDIRQAIEADVREFASWRYDPPYDVYDITDTPGEAVEYFLGPDVNCHTLLENGDVTAFCTFGNDARVPGGDYSLDAIDIGLGVKPELTGTGRGSLFVESVVAHAIAAFGPPLLRVTISVGNTRARRVWTNAGFTEVARFGVDRAIMGSSEFAILTLDV